MFRKIIAKVLPLLVAMPFYAQHASGPDTANYKMEIFLDDSSNIINGSETLTWKNCGYKATRELRFHLYWNAFQNTQSTLSKESSRIKARMKGMKKKDLGYCIIKSIRTSDNDSKELIDITHSLHYIHPDDDNVNDQTVCSVNLPWPVDPGDIIVLVIQFQSKIPKPILLTGYRKNYYFIAQWFPKIGVFKGDHWVCHQYHSHTEFYSNFGTYDVKITLPKKFIVGATGTQVNKKDNENNTVTYRFHEKNVHDFAFAASPRFIQHNETYRFDSKKNVEIILLLQPEHRMLKNRFIKAIKNSLTYFSKTLGDYPYSTITCVDPAFLSRSAGMEYPTLFTSHAYFLTRPGIPMPEATTIHEFAHQYFYGLIATDESENAWMDEGFTSFMDSEIYYSFYGEPYYYKEYFGIPFTFKKVKIPIEAVDSQIGVSYFRHHGSKDIMQRYSWNFFDYESYIANVYVKAELMLRTLKRILGNDTWNEVLKNYFIKWSYGHPRPKDFFSVLEETTNENWDWFFDQIVYGSGKIDYAVSNVKNKIISSQKNKIKVNNKKRLKNKGIHNPLKKKTLYKSEVTVSRQGEVKIPVEILVTFKDGSNLIKQWDGDYNWKKFVFENRSPIISAVVDPHYKIVLDINRTNNSWTTKPSKFSSFKLTSIWLFWLQHLFESLALLSG